MSDDNGSGELYKSDKSEVAEPTDTPSIRSVQMVVSDPAGESESGEELEGELNEVAAVTDTPGSIQEVIEEAGDECESDGEVSDSD